MKSIIKKIGKRVLIFGRQHIVPLCGRIFRNQNRFCNVIYYHDIVCDEGYSYMRTNLDVFYRQMNYLVAHGIQTLKFDELDNDEALSYGKKKVIIAFLYKYMATERQDILTTLIVCY